jgi:hypothetical protein
MVKESNGGKIDLKWTYKDSPNDYNKFTRSQFYNHFQNNGEITTKTCLSKNLLMLVPNKILSEFYPRTYDLSFKNERKSFKMDYEQN